jgi:hypothetical protein
MSRETISQIIWIVGPALGAIGMFDWAIQTDGRLTRRVTLTAGSLLAALCLITAAVALWGWP